MVFCKSTSYSPCSSTKLASNSLWFLPTRWRDSKFKILFPLAPFLKKDFLSTLQNQFQPLSPPSSPLLFQVQSTFLPNVQWHFFRGPVTSYVTKNGRPRKTAKDSAQGHRRKGKTRTWNFLRLGPGFGNQETVTFEHHFWCAKIICGRIL